MTMPPEKNNPTAFSDKESNKNLLEKEIREIISTLTRRLFDLQKQPQQNYHPPGSSNSTHLHHNHQSGTSEDDRGVQVITLAGSNTGASMRGELDSDKSSSPLTTKKMDPKLDSYVNSNFQGINNSIMMGGSYSSNDPGVHLDITDYEPEQFRMADSAKKHVGKHKGKKKEKSVSKSDYHSEPNTE